MPMNLETMNDVTDSTAWDAPSVGSMLRAERERRGLTHKELAGVTRIQQHLLGYLEEDRFGEFPAEVFARGFLRNYARELGLDEREVVERYLEQTGIERDPVRVSLETGAVEAVSRSPGFKFPDPARLGAAAYAVAIGVFVIGLAVSVLIFGGDDTNSAASFQPTPTKDSWHPASGGQFDWQSVREN
jgi:cytoskeleton protein RodZ